MPLRTSPWPDGTPCWIDLTVSDFARSAAFYSAVCGWTVDDPDPSMGNYANARVDGAEVAGLVEMDTPDRSWHLYLATGDIDRAAAEVTERGGQLLFPPHDVPDGQGRFCLAVDPTGATFGLWQAGTHLGMRRWGEFGSLGWEDLRSTDPETARTFYAGLFGFAYEPIPMAGADYTTFAFAAGQPPLGGMGGLMGSDASHWSAYVAVADVEAAVAAARANGGRAGEPFDTPYGRMATVTDPDGAELTVLTPTGPQPER